MRREREGEREERERGRERERDLLTIPKLQLNITDRIIIQTY